MAAPAAAADASAILHDGVADLARCARDPAPNLAALHNGRADARADEDTDEVVIVATRAKAMLAIGGDLDVIADGHRHAELLSQQVGQGEVIQPLRQIGRGQQDALCAVYLARDANTNSDELLITW